MRHGFLSVLEGSFTLGLLVECRFLAFTLLLFLFPLTLELFGPLALHEVEISGRISG